MSTLASKAAALKAKKPSGFILYRGPSAIDGSPIVVVVTGFRSSEKKANTKTGRMLQVYILADSMDPQTASRTGADSANCGDCMHRGMHRPDGSLIEGTRTCYVVLLHGPRVVWQGYQNGAYVDATPDMLPSIAAGRKVRLGSYGDPAAVPYWIWDAFLRNVLGITAYTHQWRRFPELSQWCMASVDSVAERVQARALGFRTFRVDSDQEWTKGEYEALCGASEQAGHLVQCQDCLACSGKFGKARCDIVIPLHTTVAASRRRVAMAA